jgi:hypothetical protein
LRRLQPALRVQYRRAGGDGHQFFIVNFPKIEL